MTSNEQQYQQASIKTADNLRTIAHTLMRDDVSRLTLPEVDAAVDLVGRLVPAGNVPGVILNGLARLSGKQPNVRRDVNLMFDGVDNLLDKAVFGAFFMGPAAVIWGYQNLLKVAGHNPDEAFPDGTWQFYIEYALRDDTARHSNETHGFDTTLNQHRIQLLAADRAAAWVMTAIHTIFHYASLLENEWRERVYINLLNEVTDGQFADLYREWEKQRPYQRGQDVTATDDYPTYRRIKFDRFLNDATATISDDVFREWEEQIKDAEKYDLPRYIDQMTIQAYLEPEAHGEKRVPVRLEQALVGVIFRGHYYLIPVCREGHREPNSVETVRQQIVTLMQYPADTQMQPLTSLAVVKRSSLAALYNGLPQDMQYLRMCPILVNLDRQSRQQPLAQLRQAERGTGDHALTIFDTGETFVFDQSHIFFDGAWGAALAEIMTNEALSWAVYLNAARPVQPATSRPYNLNVQFDNATRQRIQKAPTVTPEASAESDDINIRSILTLRNVFKQRSDLLRLTVNDILILFRAIHGVTYVPADDIVRDLEAIGAKEILAAISAQHNPAILIPVDASQRSPRDRLYPMTFEVPLGDLNLLELHEAVMDALEAYKRDESVGERSEVYGKFDKLQREYLATLAGFGDVMSRAKEIAIAGESSSVGSIKLLAHMPTPLQRLLDNVPGRFDVLNDIIKGREVFSNVGAVAKTSTLTRFITAKDDNEKKTLAWGVITDAKGVMRMSLRDFRPHVRQLQLRGEGELAQRIAEDTLDAYTSGLNQYIRDLRRITVASRETRLAKIDLTGLDK